MRQVAVLRESHHRLVPDVARHQRSGGAHRGRIHGGALRFGGARPGDQRGDRGARSAPRHLPGRGRTVLGHRWGADRP